MPFQIMTTVLGKRAAQEVYSAGTRAINRPFRVQQLPRPGRQAFTTSRCLCQSQERQEDEEDLVTRAERKSKESVEKEEQDAQKRKVTTSASSRSAAETGKEAKPASRAQLDDWEHNPNLSISKFSELPGTNFGVNQHLVINEEFKEALRQVLWKFRAPIRYAFAYGSGVFPQTSSSTKGTSTLHPNPPDAVRKTQAGNQKMIDFIFGVSYTQHWHSLNLSEHRDHYSALGSLGSGFVSRVQDSFGAGVYFNPYITVNGTLIKYGVVNIDTLCRDLSEWDTLYLAGRLQKPVKILRDNPSVRLANQVNLISAVRVALLLLPETFTESELYGAIAGISYKGDPRMSVGGDDPKKVANIVKYQINNFRNLYAPLIDNLPNVNFKNVPRNDNSWLDDPKADMQLQQNMDPVIRGHMVRRLPEAFRKKLYFEYQAKFKIARKEFREMMEKDGEDPDRLRKREGGEFERRIARDVEAGGLKKEVEDVIAKTVSWPSTVQSIKSAFTAGFKKSLRYAGEKRGKARNGTHGDGIPSGKETASEKKS